MNKKHACIGRLIATARELERSFDADQEAYAIRLAAIAVRLAESKRRLAESKQEAAELSEQLTECRRQLRLLEAAGI